MREPTFDIFAGPTDKDAIWVDAVEGLSNARARMHEVAAIIPGEYFVFFSRDRSILARTETFSRSKMPNDKTASLSGS